MKLFTLFLILIMILLMSCKVCKDQKLNNSKSEYFGNEIRTDGYYYASNDDGKTYVIIILYTNGIFSTGSYSDKSLVDIESNLADGSYEENQKNIRRSWGIFFISQPTIKTESWKATHCGHKVGQLEGNVLNDTTFEIGNQNLKDDKILTYHFKQFAPKPDSANKFIP